MMKRPDSPNLLPLEVEEHLSHLLERWATDNRLPAARARSIREGVQERDGWNQKFWMRMSPVLMRATAVVRPIPSKLWDLALPIEADLASVSSQDGFDAPGFCPYLRFGR